MSKYIQYDRNDTALNLAKIYKKAKKERLKMVYELGHIFGQELEDLHNLVQRKCAEIEHMAAKAQADRQERDDMHTLHIN